MNKPTVLVLGTGYAGQGHAEAFRYAGAEVVGIVGRTPEVVKQVATDMQISYGGTNWLEALEKCKPDIVSIATPGGVHYEPIMQALDYGCHIYSDKPLAENSKLTGEIYQKALEKGVKTAYAASYRYMPAVLHAKKLIADGAIGEPREFESISHFNLDPHIPFGWSHRAEMGGGRLNNNFTHLLSIATHVLGENLISLYGEARNDMPKAPVVEGVHNFTKRREFIPKDIDDPTLQWKEANVEWSYTVMGSLQSDFPAPQPVSLLFKHGGLAPRFMADHLVFYGSKGALFLEGHYGGGPLFLLNDRTHHEWQELDTPQAILDALPAIEDDTQRNWTHLAKLFIDDVCGAACVVAEVAASQAEPYQTFAHGHQYQEIIDAVRGGTRWKA